MALPGLPMPLGVTLGKGPILAVPPCLPPPWAGSKGRREGNLDGQCWEPSLSLQEEYEA